MSIVSFPKKTFEKDIGKLDEKMQERISLFGTPIENITDSELQLEITANRPDMLSYHGFIRSFKSFLGKTKGLKQYKVESPKKDFYVTIDKSVEKIRPYTVCSIVKGIKLSDEKIKELIDLQEKLHNTLGRKRKKLAIGIYPLDKIKFPITFKALEPDKIRFVPLGMSEELNGFQILQRHPAGRDYSNLLANKEKFPIFIDKNNQILSMPPVINSELTGRISETTKDVFVECSGFDLNTLKKCLNIVTTTLADMSGEIQAIEIKYSKKEITPNFDAEKIKLNIENVNKLLGLSLNEKQIQSCLEKMGYDYKAPNVLIPAWRTDILHEVDIIEDIAIAYGYDNFIPEIPEIATIAKEDKKELLKKKIADILVGKEFLEISNYHLTTPEDQFEKMGIKTKEMIELENAKTNYKILRENLTHYMLKILSENVDAEYPHKLFETGVIFEQTPQKILERQKLCIAISPGNVTDIKQVLEYLMNMLNTQIKVLSDDEQSEYLIEGRTGRIMLNDIKIGTIGEIHPKILRNWKIKMPVSILELDLDELFKKFN